MPVRAGVSTVNGVGELTKKLEIDEWGVIETPVYLCGTHAVGTVYQAAVKAAGGITCKDRDPRGGGVRR